MDGLILFLVGLVSGVSIVTLLNISEKGREGSKGITQEHTTSSGIKHTAKKDREEHIV